MVIKKLNGHSGCEVLLYKNDNNFFVRKISQTKNYNERLNIQIEKQKSFKSDLIKKPNIIDCCYNDDKFYCDMQFINGVNFSNIIETSNITEIDFYFHKIINFIQNNNFIDENVSFDVNQKIKNLNIDLLKYDYYIKYCHDFDWTKVKKSYCHGDLTFENILIFNKNIYFIDFLDSSINTKFIDVSKMLQDIILFWSWRHSKQQPYIKLIHLYDIIKASFSVEEMLSIKKLLVLNMLRIIPYCSTIEQYEIVNERLNFLKEYYINE